MKNTAIYLFIFLIAFGVILDQWFSVTLAGNISIAIIWLIIIFNILLVFSSGNDLNEIKIKKSKKYILLTLLTFNVFVLFAAGWFFTGFCLLFSFAILSIALS